jgi:hypothetical protein
MSDWFMAIPPLGCFILQRLGRAVLALISYRSMVVRPHNTGESRVRTLGNQRILIAAGLVVGLASIAGALPPATVSLLYQSGQNVPQVGSINHPFNAGAYGGSGFLGFAVNNSGSAYVNVSIYSAPPFVPGAAQTNQAVLFSGTGLSPYLGGGVEWDNSNPPGSVTIPTTDYMYVRSYATALNNTGTGIFSLLVGPNTFSSGDPVSGVYFNKSAMPLKEGDPVTASGVAPGTVIGSTRGVLRVNDNNVVLSGCTIVESGQSKNALLKIALDSNGAVLSETLVAKVGGPVGAGPATWISLSIAPNTCAINASGQVIFSGTTSAGIDGIYRTSGAGGSFVAVAGGATPGGSAWGSLTGAPVDINSGGHFAFRGIPGGNGLWNEAGDAGETFGSPAGYSPTTGNVTSGGGPLTLISGSLSNDFDVDVYQILIGDPTLAVQQPFSATTVPNPGSGFAGASFDTVLYLFAFNTFNNNGSTRHGVGRCDDAAPGVMQSTLTAASVPPNHTPGNTYFLAIATPKARAVTSGNYTTSGSATEPYPELWQQDPGQVAVAGGVAYWVDPSKGQIGRADTTTGAALAPLQVGIVPQQLSGVQAADPNSKLLDAKLAVYDGGVNSKVFFQQHGWGQETFRTCNTDGSGAADLVLPTGFGPSATTAMTVDSVNAKFYWAKNIAGGSAQINRCDLDGNNAETVVTISDPLNSGESYVVEGLGIDTAGTGKVYWSQTVFTIPISPTYFPGYYLRRANLDGTSVQTVVNNIRASGLSIDSVGRRLYYTSNSLNKVGVLNLTTLANTQLVSTTAPLGVCVDAPAGKVYWTSPFERFIRRSPTAAGSVENWFSLGQDVGEVPADGPAYAGYFSSFARSGTAGSTALPYQIKLTGAAFANQASMICKDNAAKIAAVGENLPGTTRLCLNAGAPSSPVRISDRGLVGWWGAASGGGDNGLDGIYLNSDKLYSSNTIPANGSVQVGNTGTGANGFDMSSSGQYILAGTTYLPFTGPSGNSAIMVSFASVPGCAADFNGDGALSVQDIFDFLSAWFAGTPSADFNGVGGLSVQDIFDFLSAWFAGC